MRTKMWVKNKECNRTWKSIIKKEENRRKKRWIRFVNKWKKSKKLYKGWWTSTKNKIENQLMGQVL